MIVRHEKRSWTRREHDLLVSMMGKPEKELAQVLGRTQGAIQVRLREIRRGETFTFPDSPPVKTERKPIELATVTLGELK